MKFNKNILVVVATVIGLSGCDKVQKLTGSKVACDDEVSKQLVVETFSKNLSKLSVDRVKSLISEENITLDMGKLRAALKGITFNVNDVRTNNSDPNSKKEYCVTEFVVKIPAQMIKDADAARSIYNENNVGQAAILADLTLETDQIKKELEYTVQPTDDGKKVYISLENSESVAIFVRDIAIDSLLKAARQNAFEIEKQEQMKQEAQEQADAEEYQSLLISEAQATLDTANENLNLVWNATTKEIRSQLLDEQRLGLKKRDLECKIGSTESDNPEVSRITCEANMTTQRINVLRQKIYYLES